MKPTAVTILVERRGKFAALIHYKRHRVEIPGGKIDPGESAIAAARRELREESGLVATRLVRLCTIQVGDHLCVVYSGRATGRLKTSTEGPTFWCSRRRLLTEGTFAAEMRFAMPLHDRARDRLRG